MKTRRRKATPRDRGLLAHVREAQARKVALTQYCRANGLNVQSVYNLRSRLASTKSRHRQVAPGTSKPAQPFIAVRVALRWRRQRRHVGCRSRVG